MSLETKDLVNACKRQPLLLGCGILGVALLALLYFRFGVPGELQARLDESDKQLARLSNNVKFSAQLDNQLKALEQANSVIGAGALRPGELARNQQIFYRLEAESGVKLLDLRQQPVPPLAKGATPTLYVPIVFSLTVQGDYEQIVSFLKRLEKSATLSRLSSASIARPIEGPQSISLTVELLGLRS